MIKFDLKRPNLQIQTYLLILQSIDRLTSNETSNLDKPINNSNEAEIQITLNQTPNVNTSTENLHETESQLMKITKQSMKVIKTIKRFK